MFSTPTAPFFDENLNMLCFYAFIAELIVWLIEVPMFEIEEL
jgi:hypothetical protein